jgi:serine-type D-Ala-D-Ala carboxypeptidase (penicillin-binding protein 5/6)
MCAYYAIKKYRYAGHTGCQRQQPQPAVVSVTPRWMGLKTGHTQAAGYCLVASAKREFPQCGRAKPAQSVVLGADSENALGPIESQKLAQLGVQPPLTR